MTWLRVARLALPVVGVCGASLALREDDNFVSRNFLRTASMFSQSPKPWNFDWDFREPLTQVAPKKLAASSDEERAKLIANVTPTATRHILLIRHGQYHQDHDDLHLTELGRAQARLVGERLAKSGRKIDRFIVSTMRRARETADIIFQQLPNKENLKVVHDPLIEEGYPCWPEPPPTIWWEPEHIFFEESARIEAAFRKYIHRAPVSQKEDSLDVLVCHGNVIRYFVVRALQFEPDGWLRFGLANASVTKITIRPNGAVWISGIGDSGHLPEEMTTFN